MTRCGVPPIAGVTLSTWYDISFLSRKDKLNGYENLAGPCANGATAQCFYTRNSHTCTEERYRTQISKLFFIDIKLGESLDIFVNLANRSCNFFYIDGLVFPRESWLLVGDDEAEDRRNRDLAWDLCQTKHKKVRPAVSYQSDLGVVPE